MDNHHLLAELAHPKQAKVGDYVFVWPLPGHPGVDIVRVTKVWRSGELSVEGRTGRFPRTSLLPPTEHRKQQYLEGLRLGAYPVVWAFTPDEPLPKFPSHTGTSPHVVGRPGLAVIEVYVSRTPSNYLDVRFGLRNDGQVTVALGEYTWHEDDKADPDATPFAYLGDERFKVFEVEHPSKQPPGKLYPGHTADYRAAISNRAGAGVLSLLVPSGVLGGATGTYTKFVVDAPTPDSAIG